MGKPDWTESSMSVRDTRLMERALRERWPIKQEYREAIIKRLIRIIADPASSAREVASASRALLAAEAQNQQDQHKVIDVNVATRHDRLASIAADLGIEVGLIENAAREAGSGIGSLDEAPEADQAASD
jgi:hypothetical protein